MIVLAKILSILLLQFFTFCLGDYSYDPRGPYGPSKWYIEYPDCGGDKQSPISIVTVNVVREDFQPLVNNFGKARLGAVEIFNNGHTVMLRTMENVYDKPYIHGGPFEDDSYVLEQIHFHWGPNDRFGSEHRVNRKRSSMEMHSVFYNTKYTKFSLAALSNDPRALVVIAAFVDGSNHHQREFWNFAKNLSMIEQAGTRMIYDFQDLPFSEIISPSGGYYTYEGSLTTPPCSEIVTWIVLKYHMKIASQLLLKFRRMLTSNQEFIYHNFRSTMPLNGRIVYSKLENAFTDIKNLLKD